MTNIEIMQASLLDIIFDRRNKDYGAYALRRDYSKRLMIALGISLLLIFLISLLVSFSGKNKSGTLIMPEERIVKIIDLTPDPPKPPEMPQTKPTSSQPPPSESFTSQIKIEKDFKMITTDVPDQSEFDNKEVSTISNDDNRNGGKSVAENIAPKTDGNSNTHETIVTEKEPIISYSDPEFPGGQEALNRFFYKNLNTPDELSAGEKKMVQIKFQINKEGIVSGLEIIKSGGEVFDKEVIRVCNKMPRWKPAKQNGINVAVSFLLPVTFITNDQ